MILETERLELVALTPGQLGLWTEDLAALEAELGCHYRAEPMEGAFLEIVRGQWRIAQEDPENYLWHSFFFLIRKEDRTVVGSADFKGPPDEAGLVELGYGLGEDFRGRGYMTEAAETMCRWALAREGVSGIIAETEREPEGLASQGVLTRCGFREYARGETVWWRSRGEAEAVDGHGNR